MSDPEDDLAFQIQISTAFFPDSTFSNSMADLVLRSSDNVHFYVHASTLLFGSNNGFAALVLGITPSPQDPPMLQVSEPSEVLNVILHTMYDASCAHFSPPFLAIQYAVESFPKYGIDPQVQVAPGRPLYDLLVSRAPTDGLEVYTLAGHFELDALAVYTSSHLLGIPLYHITDELADRMGWKYMVRLLRLHSDRVETLKKIIFILPRAHRPTHDCGRKEQDEVARLWSVANSKLTWELRSDLSVAMIETILTPAILEVDCPICQKSLMKQLQEICNEWTAVPSTI